MTWTPDIVVAHMPCDDGFASAWIARKRWSEIVFKGTNYGQPFPDVDITDKNLLIADFSYQPVVLEKLRKQAKSIILLDHHKSAQADLQEYILPLKNGMFTCERVSQLNWFPEDSNILAHFDMQHSGAALTWNFCFPDQPMPLMIQLIEDRDLWRFNLKDTRAFSLYLRSYPMHFAIWDIIDKQLMHDRHAVINEAQSIERFYDRQIAEIVSTATLKQIGQWKDVPVAHTTYGFASDVAHELLKAYPNAPFAAVVVDAYGGRTYSLRSEDTRQDVSVVAKTFGGGGHRNASGFRVPV